MKQTIFENKQRAEELMREAIRIWRESDHGDQLEGIEHDPVFSLLMTALAYQSNETESFLEQMKSDVLNDFARMLTPYEVGHAIPATAVIETSLQSGISDLELNEQHVFTLPETDARFISLLQTRVLNASIRSVVRMDGRRWKVSLKFDSPISDLSGFCFAVRNQNFKNLRLYVKGQLLPLISPWDLSELPLMSCFNIDSIMYNHNQTYRAAASCMDLFSRQNIRLYYIKKHQGSKYIPSETDSIDLVFEFTGIRDGFLFDRNNLSLNSLILVNANVHTVDISATTPIVRVTGFQSPSSENDGVIRLLEVSESVPPMEEVLPFDFDAAPNDNIPYPSSIILIAPEDMEKIETGRMSLPVGWLPVWQAVDYTFLKKSSETIKKG